MFARTSSIHLKSNMLSDYTRTFEKDVVPLLRKQHGFKDEIRVIGPGGANVTAISLWENRNDAEAYNADTYPEVLKKMARFIKGKPKVDTFDVVTSTLHRIAVHAAA
jgi:heme-degrading monooxygenase HmoA